MMSIEYIPSQGDRAMCDRLFTIFYYFYYLDGNYLDYIDTLQILITIIMFMRSLSLLLVVSTLYVFSLNSGVSIAATADGVRVAQLSYSEQLLRQEGTLEDGDTILPADGSHYDTYYFKGHAGQAVSIILSSEDFNPYLFLLGPEDNLIKQSDDFTDNDLTATMLLVLPSDGTYTVIVNSYDKTGRGRYTLSVTAVPEPPAPEPSATP